ncbi:MAG: hypothetical protein AB7P03_06640 [Kofleriaceae bacterium]
MKMVGERRAIAVAVMAFYGLLFMLTAFLSNLPPEQVPMMAAVGAVYVLAFFSLVAGYFWARWYAVGVSLFGLLLGALFLWQIGIHPVSVFVFGTHLLATLMLWGDTMAEPYDGQKAWRERFHMDESAVNRLGRSVIRAGVSLPMVLIYALQPKPNAALVVGLIALGLTGLGMHALVRLRTWGVVALGAAGTLLLSMSATQLAVGNGAFAAIGPGVAGSLLIVAIAPFASPIVGWLARR